MKSLLDEHMFTALVQNEDDAFIIDILYQKADRDIPFRSRYSVLQVIIQFENEC